MRTPLAHVIRIVAYNVQADPLYTKIEKALDAAKADRWPQANTFLSGGISHGVEKNIKDKIHNYPSIRELMDIKDKYDQAVKLTKSKDPRVTNLLSTILSDLVVVGPEINKLQLVHAPEYSR